MANTTIIPALPEWYACEPSYNKDFTACVAIHYEPIIAWAVTDHQEEEGAYINTIPIFSVGGPGYALGTLVSAEKCGSLFYKQPDGKFRGFDACCETEQQVMNHYSAIMKRNKAI